MKKRFYGGVLIILLVLGLCLSAGATSTQSLTVTAEETQRYLDANYDTDMVAFLTIDVANGGSTELDITVTTSDNVQFDPFNPDWRTEGIILSAGEDQPVYVLPVKDLAVGDHSAWVTFTADNGESETVNLTFSVLNAVSATPANYDFGQVLITGTLPTATITISNTRNEAVQIGAVEGTDFEINCAEGYSVEIAAGGTAEMVASIKSAKLGSFEETLWLYDMTRNAEVAPVTLSYVGYTDAALAPDASILNWGEAFPNDPGEAQLLILTNNTDQDMTVTASTGNYYSVVPATLTLAAGATGEVDVVLNKDLPLGEHTETITFTAGSNTATVDVAFYGVSPADADLGLHFGVVAVGGELPGYTGAFVQNVSNADLEFALTVPSGFEVDPTCLNSSGKLAVPVDEGAMVYVKPTVSTASAGEYSGTLVLTDANAPSHPVNIALALSVREGGTTDNYLSAEPSTINLGEVDVSSTCESATITVYNSSDEDIAIVNYEYTGSESAGIESGLLPANGSIEVLFMLEGGFRVGAQSETLTLKGNTSTLEIPVTYTGVSTQQTASSLTVTPGWDLGGYTALCLYEGYDPTAEGSQVTIGNSGEAALTVSASVTGGQMDSVNNVVIQPNGSQYVIVYPPAGLTQGETKATLTVTATDGQTKTLDIYFRILPPVTVSATTIDLGVVPTVGELPTGTVTLTYPDNQFTEYYAEVLATGDDFTFSPRGGEMAANSTLEIQFTPNTILEGEQTLSFIVESSNGHLFATVTVKYTGEAPDPLSANVTSISLGSLYANGAIGNSTVTLTNNTNEAVTVSSETNGYASISLSSTTIPAAGSVTATLSFSGYEMAVGQGSETVTFTAGSNSANVKVSYEILNPIQVDVTSLTFDEIEAGGTAPQGQTVTIANLSPTDEAWVKVTAPEGFTASGMDTNGYLSVMPGESGQITVTPTATTTGVYDGVLTLKEENCSQTLSVALAYTVAGPNPLTASVNTEAKYLAEGYTVNQVTPVQVTVGNTGDAAVTVTAAAQNATLSSSSVTVAAGGSQTLSVLPVSGLAAGDHTATVTVTYGRYTKTVSFTFKVMKNATISPTTLDFGELSTIGAIPSKTFTITNPRSTALELAPIACEYFTFDPAYGEIPAGGSLTVTVKPTQINEGSITSSVEIVDNFDEDMIMGKVTMKYTGVAPTPLVISQTSLDFGTVFVNAPGAGKTVTLTNNTKEAVAVSASTSDKYAVSLSADTIPALGQVTATITLKADMAMGAGSDTVTFTAGENQVSASLAFTGKTPVELSAASLDFGGIAEGFDLPAGKSLTVKNLSSGTMAVKFTPPSGYTVEGSGFDASGWLTLEDGPNEKTVTVTPTATAVGAYNGSLAVELMSNGHTQTVSLSFSVAKVEKAEVVETVEALPEAPVEQPVLVLAPEAVPEDENVTLHFAKVEEEIPVEEEVPAGEPVVGTVTYEVFLKNDEGEEVDLEASCQLIFPYPEGMTAENASLYEITIVHYASSGTETFTNNTIEFLPQGMGITVHSFSPFTITFKREPGKLTLDKNAIAIDLLQGYDVSTLTLPTFGIANGGSSDITVSGTAQGDAAAISFASPQVIKPGEGLAVTVTPRAGLTPGEYQAVFTFSADTGETAQVTVTVKVTAAPKAPATGDEATPLLWGMMLMAGAALMTLSRRKQFN